MAGQNDTFFYLTKNVYMKEKLFGINKRNIFEAVFFTSAIIGIIAAMPFTDVVQNMSLVILIPTIFIFNIRGIKNKSFTQIIFAEIRFRRYRRRLHLRGPEYARKKYKAAYAESEDESVAEHYLRLVKEHINGFVEKYSSDENS